MKRYLGVGVVAVLALVGWRLAHAQMVQGGDIGSFSNPIKILTVTEDTDSAGSFTAGNHIVGFKLVATAASAACTLYDAATLPAGTNSNVIDELAEVNSSATALQIWPNPYQLTTDLSVDVRSANCLIYYY